MARHPLRPSFARAPLLPSVIALACLAGCGSKGGTPGTGGTGAPGGSGTTGTGGGGGTTPDNDGAVAFSRAELLGAFGSCAANQVRDFQAKAMALDTAVAAYAAGPDAATRDAARQAFKDALDSWAVIDPIQFGPTASTVEPGGKGLRGEIYNWPNVSRCFIEENIVLRAYQALPTLTPSHRGLWALEYLLFYEGADSECAPAPAGWTALSADELATRKRAYAVAAAHDVLARAVTLNDAWDPAKMNFVQTMRTAGSGSAVYPTQLKAIESVGLGIFFLDRMVKDKKLGIPLGLDPLVTACTVASPPAACYESPFAGRSKANLRANLDGVRRILEGCEAGNAGFGFDDLLDNIGATDAATHLRTVVAAADAAIAAIEEEDLPAALAADKLSVQTLRDAIGAIATFLKTEMYTLLGFEESVIPTDTDS
jgi:predicted lipoprotein